MKPVSESGRPKHLFTDFSRRIKGFIHPQGPAPATGQARQGALTFWGEWA